MIIFHQIIWINIAMMEFIFCLLITESHEILPNRNLQQYKQKGIDKFHLFVLSKISKQKGIQFLPLL